MTKEILNELVKSKKINLDFYDKVLVLINSKYTYIYVTFGVHECIDGEAKFVRGQSFRLSVSSIMKKGKYFPEDYETSPFGDFIWSLK